MIFIVSDISGNFPTRGHMIDFLSTWPPKLMYETPQEASQEASKIDPEGHRDHDASRLGSWTPLGIIFWVELEGKLGSSWHQNLTIGVSR